MIVVYVLRIFPRFLLKIFFSFLAFLLWWLVPKRRKITINNIKHAFKRDDEWTEKIAKKTYIFFADFITDCIKLLGTDKEKIRKYVEIEGLKNFLEAKKKSGNIIWITAHFSNWEIMAYAFSVLEEKFYIVARPLDCEILDNVVNRLREKGGNKVISSRKSSMYFLNLLRKKIDLGVLIDQDAGGKGMFVDFFGRKASASEGMALFSLRLNVPILPAYITKKNKKFVVHIEPMVKIKEGANFKEKTYNIMQSVYNRFEEWIKEYPHCYFWVHNRWKSKPNVKG
jgi:KDO2-lipid IV(A) lauroyltransferase